MPTTPEETYNDNDLQCPHCLELQRDSCELGLGIDDDGETECAHCGRPILWTRHILVAYTGKAKPE